VTKSQLTHPIVLWTKTPSLTRAGTVTRTPICRGMPAFRVNVFESLFTSTNFGRNIVIIRRQFMLDRVSTFRRMLWMKILTKRRSKGIRRRNLLSRTWIEYSEIQGVLWTKSMYNVTLDNTQCQSNTKLRSKFIVLSLYCCDVFLHLS
jgi:hypothetical protein